MRPSALPMTAASAPRILVVDDDRRLCGFLCRFLGSEGYGTATAHDGRAMRRVLADSAFDLVILDLTFPAGEDGVSLARGLRAQYHLPLIMLSGKHDTIDKVVCLELGADDYVTKPFEPRELLARIRTVLRRAGGGRQGWEVPAPEADRQLRFDGWRLDLACRELRAPDGEPVQLTTQEFELLAALAARPGRPLSRDQILDLIANRHWSPCDRSIDVLVGKLRRKLGDAPRGGRLIKTVRGIGYLFAAPSG
ncbi:MAG: response regulator transcription factor [Geminicoccaceae bacterium]